MESILRVLMALVGMGFGFIFGFFSGAYWQRDIKEDNQ